MALSSLFYLSIEGTCCPPQSETVGPSKVYSTLSSFKIVWLLWEGVWCRKLGTPFWVGAAFFQSLPVCVSLLLCLAWLSTLVRSLVYTFLSLESPSLNAPVATCLH